MSASVELVHRSNVFLTACSSVVDVMVLKGPLSNQLQVILFEENVATDVPRLCLNYPAIVKRLARNAQQTQLNVVIDSSTECSDVEHLRTLIRNKAIFDFIVSGLYVTFDSKEMKIVKIDSKYASRRTEDSDHPRSLSIAANRVSSFIGKMITESSKMSTPAASSKLAASVKMRTDTETPTKAQTETAESSCCNTAENHAATNACSPNSEIGEPNKYADASGEPAKRLAQYFLKRMNSSSRHLTDSCRSLTTDAMESAKTNTEVNCDTYEFLHRTQAPPSLVTPGGSMDEDFSHAHHKHHPSMHKPSIVRDLVVNTDLGASDCYDEEEEWQNDDESHVGGASQASGRGRSSKKGGAGASARANITGVPIAGPGGASLKRTISTKLKPRLEEQSTHTVSWWLSAIFTRMSTKKATVYAQ